MFREAKPIGLFAIEMDKNNQAICPCKLKKTKNKKTISKLANLEAEKDDGQPSVWEDKNKWGKVHKALVQCMAQKYSPEKPSSLLPSKLWDLKKEAWEFISKNWVSIKLDGEAK